MLVRIRVLNSQCLKILYSMSLITICYCFSKKLEIWNFPDDNTFNKCSHNFQVISRCLLHCSSTFLPLFHLNLLKTFSGKFQFLILVKEKLEDHKAELNNLYHHCKNSLVLKVLPFIKIMQVLWPPQSTLERSSQLRAKVPSEL